MARFFFLPLAAVLSFGLSAFAQTGSISGSAFDRESGDELIGANVLVTGTTTGASTDIDGKYSIRGILPGTYSLRFSFVGYTAKVVSDVAVKAGEDTRIDVTLAAETYQQDEIVVTAERILSTEASVLAERRRSAVIGDAISAEQIRRAPDATTGDVLKRVTGLTVVDDKFVFIRGVTDRYNGTSLNGVSVTSTDTEVDRKSFSFDLLPSNLLENTVVVKTATPDLPGSFSGGFVQVNTLDFPTSRILKVGLSSSYNSITNGRSFIASQGGSRDWLGMDDGSREKPASGSAQQLAQALPNNWSPQRVKAPLNGGINLTFGDRLSLGESDELGYLGALSYTNSFERTDFSLSPSYVEGATPAFRFDGATNTYAVLWSGLLDLNVKLSGLHKFSFKNSYTQSATDKVSESEGVNVPGNDSRRLSSSWNERSLYLLQVGGNHIFPSLSGVEVEWKLFSSSSRAGEPDRKQVEFNRSSGVEYILGENYRSWSKLNERVRGGSLDLIQTLGFAKFKAGLLVERRRRDFDISAYSTVPGRDPRFFGLVVLPLDGVFSPENYEPNRFNFVPTSTFTGKYDGTSDLNAYYAMVDIPVEIAAQRLRLVGGARLENSRQLVTSPKAIDDPIPATAEVSRTDLLPSLNLTYIINDVTNVRLAHYQSVNRPEFRELANVLYLDFDQDQNVIGNPNLQRAYVHNYDVRVEVFPDIGEVIAFSYFHKSFHDAIEERLIAAPDRYVKTWFNSPSGNNYGWEFEVRKSLNFLGDPFRFFSVTGNYTNISSEIEYTDARTDIQGRPVYTRQTRPMQGQSRWTVNVTLAFTQPDWGTSVSVLYNKFGRRLAAVGDERDQDVYEESRDLVDASVSQRLAEFLEAKVAVRNLLDRDHRMTTGDGRFFYGSRTVGRSYSLSLSLTL